MPFWLKYIGLLSLPLFATVAFILIRRAPGYVLGRHSISETILFLEKPRYRGVFRMNFIVKALIDSCFLWVLAATIHISFWSPIVWCMAISNILFAALAFVLVGKTRLAHIILIYTVGVLWAVCELLIAYRIGIGWFTLYTWVIAVVPTAIAFWYLFRKKVNVGVQVVCMTMIYSWLVIFVTKFL